MISCQRSTGTWLVKNDRAGIVAIPRPTGDLRKIAVRDGLPFGLRGVVVVQREGALRPREELT
jgi:hypothetical protein